jgi:predicted anti-sigma-YlaC factor YlaD
VRRRSLWRRAGLLYLLYVNGSVGIWATVAPRSFYDDFPGGGRTWVSTDGPFNEHLIRDVGAWSLGLAVVVAIAAWTMSRPLILTAGTAVTVAALPHAIYHARHADLIGSAVDQTISISLLFLSAAIGAAVVVAELRDRSQPTAPPEAVE